MRVTGVYGETKAFVRDPDLMTRLAQWPVAVVLSEVYRIEGEPLLIEDLGFADKNILNNAYDGGNYPRPCQGQESLNLWRYGSH
ncbi:hypothetical protein GCM10010869_21870 [Mesorhizobium tianshanense]|uniref:Uncharacterized protein n=1 Tax=Mesorhizobium tianshanense TaxID=39844 RepID=A0A562MA79_9HYPH|nr:hypothetical protein IQ26_07642 [Mesorhizobium tianshanense]GLS36596.1 hypothetical protein GCM10010869_21870 [Mesorhizobium tianshanense]